MSTNYNLYPLLLFSRNSKDIKQLDKQELLVSNNNNKETCQLLFPSVSSLTSQITNVSHIQKFWLVICDKVKAMRKLHSSVSRQIIHRNVITCLSHHVCWEKMNLMRDGKSSTYLVQTPGVKKIHWESHWAEASPPFHSADRSQYLSHLNPSSSMMASQCIITNEKIKEEGEMGTNFGTWKHAYGWMQENDAFTHLCVVLIWFRCVFSVFVTSWRTAAYWTLQRVHSIDQVTQLDGYLRKQSI